MHYISSNYTFSKNVLIKVFEIVSIMIIVYIISIVLGNYMFDSWNVYAAETNTSGKESSVDPVKDSISHDLSSKVSSEKSGSVSVGLEEISNGESSTKKYKLTLEFDETVIDKAIKSGESIVKVFAKDLIPQLGAMGVAAKVGLKTVETTVGQSLSSRAIQVTTFTGAAGLGAKAAGVALVGLNENNEVYNYIEKKAESSKFNSMNKDTIPSPDDITFNIHSIVESNDGWDFFTADSPLELLIKLILLLIILIFLCNLILLYQMFVRFVLNKNSEFIINTLDKIFKSKNKEYFEEKVNSYIKSGNSFFLFFWVLGFIILFFLLGLLFLIGIELFINIDDYCKVYTEIHDSKFIGLLISTTVNNKYNILNIPTLSGFIKGRRLSIWAPRYDSLKDNNNIFNNKYIWKGKYTNIKREYSTYNVNGDMSKYRGGYKNYKIIKLLEGFTFGYNYEFQQLVIDKNILIKSCKEFLLGLDKDKCYTVLFVAKSWNNNRIVNTLSEQSLLLHKDYPVNLLCDIIEMDIYKYYSQYSHNFNNNVLFEIMVQYREWLNEEDYNKDKFLNIKNLIVKEGEKILNKITSVNSVRSEDEGIKNGLKMMNFYGFNLPFNHWFEKELFFNLNNRDNKINSLENINNLYTILLSNMSKTVEYEVNREGRYDNLKIRFTNLVQNEEDNKENNIYNEWNKYGNVNINNRYIRKATIYFLDRGEEKVLISWIDYITDINSREITNNKLLYYNNLKVVERKVDNIRFIWDNDLIFTNYPIIEDNKLIKSNDDLFKIISPTENLNIFNNFRQEFKLKTMEELPHEQEYNNKIGVIDLETYPFEKSKNQIYSELAEGRCNNSGKQRVYAGGWRVGDEKYFYYLGDKGCESHDAIIQSMIKDIFDRGYANYTFYAHNFARFDGHFIVNSLLVDIDNHEKFDNIKLVVRDSNDLIEIVINRKRKTNKDEKKKYGKIKIRDSLNLISENLDKIGKEILNIEGKGHFPHYFMCEENLLYEGVTPNIEFFNNISPEKYNEIVSECRNLWSTKIYSLKYLETDLDILYDALISFSKEIWNDYGVNITQRKTISGLTLLIYQVNYLKKCGYKIPIIGGNIDKYFREAYFGGLTQVGAHICEEAYHYDINSQYPAAMCEELPVGNKCTLMSVNNLNNCFGIVYADIQSPSVEKLRIPILPRKLDNGIIDTPHNSKWSGWYSTVDLINAENNDYIITPKIGIDFEKGKPFVDFVNEVYDKKLKAKENKEFVKSMIYKYLLNTLYGRMGMKNEFYEAKIVENDKIKEHIKFNHWKIMDEYKNTNYTLIKTGKYIDSKLLEVLDTEDTNNSLFNINQTKWGSVSSIAIAVAITANARKFISIYKNIPYNPLIYSDTDSAILPKVISNQNIGVEIGKMKLESKVKTGIFIGKKLYAYKDEHDLVTKVSAGIDSKLLSWEDYENLINGKDITKSLNKFIVNHSEGGVTINNNSQFSIKGITKATTIQLNINEPPIWLKENKLYSLKSSVLPLGVDTSNNI
jgi:hypothetical protein